MLNLTAYFVVPASPRYPINPRREQVLKKQVIQGQYYYLNRELYAILAD